jgi:hypothetical protein
MKKVERDVGLAILADETIQRLAGAILDAEKSLGKTHSVPYVADIGIVDIDSALGRQYCLPVILDALRTAKKARNSFGGKDLKDLAQQVVISEENGTRWIHCEVSVIREILNRLGVL